MDEQPIDRALRWMREREWKQVDLAQALDTTSAVITNWKKRGMPPEWHKRVADVFGESVDALLGGHKKGYSGELSVPRLTVSEATGDVIRIPQLSVRASMGNGYATAAHEDVVQVLQVSEAGLRAQLGNTPVSSLQNLRLISAYGDSMLPTFKGGDVLLVDPGVDDVRIDAVYVTSYGGELFIKRMQRRPDGVLRMLSDNKNYDPIDIQLERRQEFKVLGRVLMAWNARPL